MTYYVGPFSLFHMPDRMKVERPSMVDDGYGGSQESLSEITAEVPCRATRLNKDMLEQLPTGKDAERVWAIYAEYTPSLVLGDVITLTSGITEMVDEPSDVIYLRHQRDAVGIWHHTSIMVEMRRVPV